jgi:hypothetical protein
MKKFSKILMTVMMAICLCLFAGCSKHMGTYIGTTSALLGNDSIELELKMGDKFEMTVGSTTKEGTWSVSEEDENVIILNVDGTEYKATVTEDVIQLPLIVDGAIGGASLAKLVKK